MNNLILQLVFMASLGVIVYLVAQAIPKIEVLAAPESKLRKLISKLPFKKIDDSLISYKERILRKIRLLIMKTDNTISKALHKDKDKPTLKQ